MKATSPSSLKTEKERLPPASVTPSSAVAKNSDFLPNQTTPSGSLVTFVRVEFKMFRRSSKMSMSVIFVVPAEKLEITEAFVRFTKTRALFSWVLAKEGNLSNHNTETILFTLDPYYGNLNPKLLKVPF